MSFYENLDVFAIQFILFLWVIFHLNEKDDRVQKDLEKKLDQAMKKNKEEWWK